MKKIEELNSALMKSESEKKVLIQDIQ